MTTADGSSPTPAVPDGASRGRPAATSRQDVARAALDLFARQGYDETTVDEIAAAVGISRRTFFRYYESKPDVVWACVTGWPRHRSRSP
jgi:AcrR family transcriptional regulator